MNKLISKYTWSVLLIALISMIAMGCKGDQPDENKSVVKKPTTEKNAFDKWLDKNYVNAYNVDFKYRMEDNERDRSKQLVPSTIENSMKLANIFRHSWFGVYDEVAGMHFMRRLAPRIIHIVGSASWNNDGTIVLATAEGGLKVTIYRGNWVNEKNPDNLNEMYFKTMHHEFTHILHQNVKWPQEYNTISAGSYAPSSWHNRKSMKEYAELGFVTAYAGHSPSEDITELTACYITYTQEQWDKIFKAAGEEGSAKIHQKLEIMKTYMKDNWNIDMDVLRDVNNRRLHEIPQMQLILPDWEPLFANVEVPMAAPTKAAQEAYYKAGRIALEKQIKVEPKDAKFGSPTLCYIATQMGDHLDDESTEAATSND